MIILQPEQGSQEWIDARIGVITASNFNRIMTTTKHQPAKDIYRWQILAELLTGQRYEAEYTSLAMERGCDLENQAVATYKFIKDVEVERVGLCLPREGAPIGCSPDGLIGEEGGLEVKCPELPTHLKYLDSPFIPLAYRAQVYGALFVTGRPWWDFMSYHPDFQPLIIRTTDEDEDYLDWRDAFEPILELFLNEIEVFLAKYKPEQEKENG